MVLGYRTRRLAADDDIPVSVAVALFPMAMVLAVN